jgi:hypothetical protein
MKPILPKHNLKKFQGKLTPPIINARNPFYHNHDLNNQNHPIFHSSQTGIKIQPHKNIPTYDSYEFKPSVASE